MFRGQNAQTGELPNPDIQQRRGVTVTIGTYGILWVKERAPASHSVVIDICGSSSSRKRMF